MLILSIIVFTALSPIIFYLMDPLFRTIDGNMHKHKVVHYVEKKYNINVSVLETNIGGFLYYANSFIVPSGYQADYFSLVTLDKDKIEFEASYDEGKIRDGYQQGKAGVIVSAYISEKNIRNNSLIKENYITGRVGFGEQYTSGENVLPNLNNLTIDDIISMQDIYVSLTIILPDENVKNTTPSGEVSVPERYKDWIYDIYKSLRNINEEFFMQIACIPKEDFDNMNFDLSSIALQKIWTIRFEQNYDYGRVMNQEDFFSVVEPSMDPKG